MQWHWKTQKINKQNGFVNKLFLTQNLLILFTDFCLPNPKTGLDRNLMKMTDSNILTRKQVEKMTIKLQN